MSRKPIKESFQYFSPAVPVAVRWTCLQHRKSRPLVCHPEYEFHFMKRGTGAYYIEGKSYRFGANHLVVIRPNQIHSFNPETEHVVEKTQLLFRREWLAGYINRLKLEINLPSLICLTDDQSLCIEMILKRMQEEDARRAPGWEEMVFELLREFLLWVQRVKGQNIKPLKENPLFAQLRRHIESHYSDPQCNVTGISKHFGYSLSYLSVLFKELSGIGLKRYLLQYRIIAARRLLETDIGLKVESIAREVGFRQYRNFNRIFLGQTGMTASSYRKFYHRHHKK